MDAWLAFEAAASGCTTQASRREEPGMETILDHVARASGSAVRDRRTPLGQQGPQHRAVTTVLIRAVAADRQLGHM